MLIKKLQVKLKIEQWELTKLKQKIKNKNGGRGVGNRKIIMEFQ